MLKRTIFISSALVVLAFIGLWALPKPDVILSISAQSETIEYQVIDGNAASISLINALFISGATDPFDAAQPPKCVTGQLLPKSGIYIRYRRAGNGAVGINFASQDINDDAGRFESRDSETITLSAADRFFLDPDNEICQARLPDVLPIRGRSNIGSLRTFGSSLEAEPGDLIGGEVRITAKAVERVFFVFKGARGLYDAGVVNLPAGAMLRSDTNGFDKKNDNSLPWIGAARMLDENGITGFQIDVSTDSDTVWLYRSGQGKSGGKPDPIGASAFVSQTSDPGLIRMQVILALILIIFQTVATVMQTVEPIKQPKSPKTPKTKKMAKPKKSKKSKSE